jgi:predicted HAD superfamily Cof-like phosphohydrolase
MKNAQDRVELFMRKAEQEIPYVPTLPSFEVKSLRYTLIEEELDELAEALDTDNIVEAADAIGDLLVVVLGAACAFGIDIDPIFKEIMDSNMTKFIDGHRRDDGKWIKGPSYTPANLAPIIEKQLHKYD